MTDDGRGRGRGAAGDDRARATRAGRPTAASPRRTPIRTATAPTSVHIVLNGIVENHAELRARADATRATSSRSETDAEIVAHLIEKHYDGDLTDAVRAAFAELRGHYAFVAMHADHPDTLVAARQECPLIVGLGEGETFVASAIPAFLAETRNVARRSRTARSSRSRPTARRSPTPTATPVEREVEEVTWDEDAAEKGGYATFMLKEIHEQPDAVAETIADRLPDTRPRRPLRARALATSFVARCGGS